MGVEDYIVDEFLRKEREQEDARIPLYIDLPMPYWPEPREEFEEEEEETPGGTVVIIDMNEWFESKEKYF